MLNPTDSSSRVSNRYSPALVTLMLSLLTAGVASAEPYLAVSKGMQCVNCHSHPAGGGKRNTYGSVFAQTELPGKRIGAGKAEIWSGEITKWLSAGADLRGSAVLTETPNREQTSEFDITRGTVYLEASLLPGRLTLYVDQQFAPSASQNREAYLRLNGASGKWHFAAGQFYLPYGLRLQDDTAFVRLATGINFTNPDRGIQAGYTAGPWSTIASITNGTGGGREIDSGKQLSIVSSYSRAAWRVGASANVNDASAGDREMAGVFAGLKTGPIAWLAELDWIQDTVPGGTSSQNAVAGLLEGNWMFRPGHNLKISYDYLDPDDDLSEDQQVRYSLVWEYTPMQFLQGRFGIRSYDGIPQDDLQNRDLLFAELHGFF